MEDQNTMQNSLIELVETFNQQPSNDDTLLDCLDKLNIVAANDNSNFIRICGSINVDTLFNIVEKYSSGSGDKKLRARIRNSSCDLLGKIFSNLTTIDVIEKYGVYIKNSATVAYVEFHMLCLQQILRLADEDNFSYFMSNPDLIEMTIKFLCEENLNTNSISGKILRKLIALNGNGWLFCDDFIKLFKKLLSSKNSVMKFRVYEVFVEYISKYPEYIEACKACKIFEGLVQILVDGNDILSQLNALEMVSQIAISSSRGLDFVQENGIIGWVSNIFSASDDPLMSFLLPGCTKFFGVLCSANPLEIVPQYKHILLKIFENINSQDPTMRCLCAETISFICTKSEGLKMLYHESDSLRNVIKGMAKIISNPGEDDYARKRTVQSLAAVFDHDVDDIEVSVICEKLFRHIDENPILFLLKLAQKPFPELRYGSLTLLGNISKYSWVEQDMVLCPAFMEYLLDRSTESEKEGSEIKYNIIKHLSVSATALDNFGRDYFDKLEKYAAQGPFYAESHVVVSYERED